MGTFCYMPFETMAIDTGGNVMPCCAFDVKHAPFNYTNKPITIGEYFNSPELQKIKEEFLAGEIPAGCVSCISKEKHGMKSKRQKWTINREKNNTQYIENREAPVFIEVAVSNKCNVACTTCNSFFSSGWKRYDENMAGHPDFIQRQELANTSFKVDDIFMEELFENVQNDKECSVELIGGEPMFNKSVLRFLKQFANNNLENNLTITTNCTLITDEIISHLEKIKNLVVVCSIDAVGPLYNYVRDYDFDTVESNIKKLLQLDAIILVMPVFSVFNIFNIPDLITWHNRLATKSNTKIKLINFAKAPYYTSLENIPKEMLQDTVNKLKDILNKNLTTVYSAELEALIDTLQEYETFSQEKQKVSLQWMGKCNIIRGKDIFKIEPRLKEFAKQVDE